MNCYKLLYQTLYSFGIENFICLFSNLFKYKMSFHHLKELHTRAFYFLNFQERTPRQTYSFKLNSSVTFLFETTAFQCNTVYKHFIYLLFLLSLSFRIRFFETRTTKTDKSFRLKRLKYGHVKVLRKCHISIFVETAPISLQLS